MSTPKICVVGSSNLDMNSYVERFPAAGETIHSGRFTTGYGGKGANQAVMAARLGGDVTFVGKVGDDLFGRDMVANLRDEGINVDYLGVTGEAASGVAVITIDAVGMNQIIVAAGANALLGVEDVERAAGAIQAADVLVCQLEVPHAATLTAMRIARAANRVVILNPAPISEALPAEFYPLCDILCPNEHEATLLTGLPVATIDEAEVAARALLARGPKHVILTLGARGSLLVDAITVLPVAAPHVTAVDTTGAGDAFVGSLAFLLASKIDLPTAIERANQIAAISVQRPGAQTSYPRAAELALD